MEAVGLIETKGLIPAIESADAMLKAAQVRLLERTLIGGGLVTVMVTGNVSAVKASVEAGAAAVRRIAAESLVSEHVIPRPHEELAVIIKSTGKQQENGQLKVENATHREDVDKLALANRVSNLRKLKALEIRNLMAEYPELALTKEMIEQTSKMKLIALIKEFYQSRNQ